MNLVWVINSIEKFCRSKALYHDLKRSFHSHQKMIINNSRGILQYLIDQETINSIPFLNLLNLRLMPNPIQMIP